MFEFNNKKGFTLIELLIAMAISTLVMAAIYSTYRSQLRSHITQQAVVEMQQNGRAAMFVMEREIKMAGYDPTGSEPPITGITVANANTITITMLADNNGLDDDIDNDGDTNIDEVDELKTITYSLAGRDLQRTADGATSTIAENIEVLDFFYFQKLPDGTLSALPPPVAAGNLANIYSVQITTITRSGENVPALMMKQTDHKTYTNQQGVVLLPDPDDNFRRIVLTADIQCRNLGL